jgi:ribose transport system permease protein
MTLLLIAGYIDLTVGATCGLAGAVTAMLISKDWNVELPVWSAILVGIAVGMAIGLFNGFFIVKLNINPFIFTLGGLTLFRSIQFLLTKAYSITNLPENFTIIGQQQFFGIQFPVFLMFAILLIGDYSLRRSNAGKKLLYIGVNRKSAKLIGINVEKYCMLLFIITGALAALAGILMTSRVGTATIAAGTNLEFEAITAAIVGGARFNGGKGTIFGTFLGTVLTMLVMNAMALLSVSIYFQNIIIGLILIIIVYIDGLADKSR